MPELPEVETVRRTLAPHVEGRTIVGFELGWPRTLAAPSPPEFELRTVGRTIERVDRRGKLVVFVLDDASVVTTHLRMTGVLLHVERDIELDPPRVPYLRAMFRLDDGSRIPFFDVRKFGRISHLSRDEFKSLSDSMGIEPFDPRFTASWLHDTLSARSRAIKPLLLDQTIIAGLGNIYVDEALFASRIHPLTPSNRVDLGRTGALRDAIVGTLAASVERHGTTLRDYRTGQGERGDNQSLLRIYGRRPSSECVVCSTPVVRIVVGQRGTTFCPTCQPPYAESIVSEIDSSRGSSTG